MIQPKPSEKGEIITYLSRMGDVLENCCVGMDLSCMLKTVRLVFTHEGAR